MIASILKIADRLELLDDLPALAKWMHAILARPAHVKAEQDQREEIARHSLDDMRYDAVS
jgi:glutathione S-transferase